ncbi:PaaI family thioesterase [Alicyclobacillus fodiniaquatilis]|uniref:PaaI family thioesterase n=1 Tax=Alicyclobacillus fodiniaquatilis TaxID=1661150 RepID=A0ABW4JPD9_9BACL
MIDDIVKELESLPQSELQSIYELIVAKKATYHTSLAFVQELMGFSSQGEVNGKYVYHMKVYNELLNRYGILHGGLMTAFIDTAMAETTFIVDNTVERALTLNITVDFIKPGLEGAILRAEVDTVQNSHSIIVFHVNVFDENHELKATALAHFYKQHKRKV